MNDRAAWTRRLLALALVIGIRPAWCQAPPPRVAVWDPVKGTREPPNRFRIDLAHLDQVTACLKDAGIPAARVTAEQIADPMQFSAGRFDALFLPGDAFPRSDLPALKQFAEEGGILVALSAKVPFLVGIAPEPDGFWTMNPKTPSFAWQSDELLGLFGLKYVYNPVMHDQGIRHTATALLKRYLPGAPEIAGRLPGNWLVTLGEGEVYPLVRSYRGDGADVVPQAYVARKGRHTAIFCGNELFTKPDASPSWPLARQTVPALARLAGDLRRGALKLVPEMRVSLSESLPPPDPLTLRLPQGSVDPEGARPLARWGRFDGSSLELGPALASGKTLALPLHPADKEVPRCLMPGASLRLAVPALGEGTGRERGTPRCWLRVRGAFAATGAGLSVSLGDTALLNESFVYVDAGGPGNYGNADLGNMPAEFDRIAYVPGSVRDPATLVLSNPGTKPLSLDALQIEARTRPAPEMVIGLNQGMGWSYPSGKNVIPRAISSQWSAIRANTRTQFVGAPDDPKRWNQVDQHIEKYLAVGVPLHLLFEGTPRWAAISEERYRESGGRPHTVPPDPAKYAEIVEHIVRKYGDRIDTYEIWNEANIGQFWRGTPEEYVTFLKTIVPLIRKLDPTARVMTTGMAGFNEIFFDALMRAGALKLVDLVAYHPYAGRSPAWDAQYGQIEGALYARGQSLEVYSNEMGFVWKPGEWFQGTYTPQVQRDLLDIAMGRLLANGEAKISLFHAGGDEHHFGLIDGKGNPRPAYQVFADYLPLGQKGGRRLDVSMLAADGRPLQGIYAAAATHADGSVTVVVNPSECEPLRPVSDPSSEMDNGAGWSTFFGKTQFADGKAAITPDAGKEYAGFYTTVSVDPDRLPVLEVSVPESAGSWDATLKSGAGEAIPIAAHQGKGVFRVEYRKLLPKGGRQDLNFTFRLRGKAVLDYVRFLPAPGRPAAPPRTVPLLLRIPLERAGTFTARARAADQSAALPIQVRQASGQAWAEIRLELAKRTVITLE